MLMAAFAERWRHQYGDGYWNLQNARACHSAKMNARHAPAGAGKWRERNARLAAKLAHNLSFSLTSVSSRQQQLKPHGGIARRNRLALRSHEDDIVAA